MWDVSGGTVPGELIKCSHCRAESCPPVDTKVSNEALFMRFLVSEYIAMQTDNSRDYIRDRCKLLLWSVCVKRLCVSLVDFEKTVCFVRLLYTIIVVLFTIGKCVCSFHVNGSEWIFYDECDACCNLNDLSKKAVGIPLELK